MKLFTFRCCRSFVDNPHVKDLSPQKHILRWHKEVFFFCNLWCTIQHLENFALFWLSTDIWVYLLSVIFQLAFKRQWQNISPWLKGQNGIFFMLANVYINTDEAKKPGSRYAISKYSKYDSFYFLLLLILEFHKTFFCRKSVWKLNASWCKITRTI